MLLVLAAVDCNRAIVVVVIISLTMDEHSLRIYCALEEIKQVSSAEDDTRAK